MRLSCQAPHPTRPQTARRVQFHLRPAVRDVQTAVNGKRVMDSGVPRQSRGHAGLALLSTEVALNCAVRIPDRSQENRMIERS